MPVPSNSNAAIGRIESAGERRARYTRLAVTAALCALVVIIGARPAARTVKGWQARQLAGEAQQLAERGEISAAFGKLRDANLIAPTEPLVTRRIAELLVQSTPTSAATIGAWKRVLEVAPDDSEARLELLMAEVLSGSVAATAAVAEYQRIPSAARASARGLLAQAILAVQQGERSEALRSFRAAIDLDRSDRRTQFQFASYLASGGTDAGDLESITLLKALRQDPGAGPLAGRLLRDIYLRRQEFAAARAEAESLIAKPNPAPEAYLALLEICRSQGDQGALTILSQRIQAEAKRDPALLGALLAWLELKGESAKSREIVEAQPDDALGAAPVLDSALAILERQGLSARLRSIVRRGDWSGREPEAEAWKLRLSSLEGGSNPGSAAWESIVSRTADDPAGLQKLLRLTVRWGWLREKERVLEQLCLRPKPERELLHEWWQTNVALRSARGVLGATRRLLELGHSSLAIRNDFAAMALLLLGSDNAQAHRFALENFSTEPGNPFYRGTFAASLRIQGRSAEGLRVLEEGGADPVLRFERLQTLATLGRHQEAAGLRSSIPVHELFPEQQAWLRQFEGARSQK